MKKDKPRVVFSEDTLDEIQLDPSNFHGACVDQVTLMIKYSKLYATCSKRAKLAEERAKTIKAELTLHAETNPKALKTRITAATVESWVRSQPDYVEAIRTAAERSYEEALLQNAMYTLNHRKSMIESLLRLELANLSPEPSIEPVVNSHTACSLAKLSRARNEQLIKTKLGHNKKLKQK